MNKSLRVKKNKYLRCTYGRVHCSPALSTIFIVLVLRLSAHVKGKRFTNAVLHYIHYITLLTLALLYNRSG